MQQMHFLRRFSCPENDFQNAARRIGAWRGIAGSSSLTSSRVRKGLCGTSLTPRPTPVVAHCFSARVTEQDLSIEEEEEAPEEGQG